MSGFTKGIAFLAGVILLGIFMFKTYLAHEDERCEGLNYIVYSFEKCIEDPAGHCFAAPGDIERYSRSLDEMGETSCAKWVFIQEVPKAKPKLNIPHGDDGEEHPTSEEL